MLVSVVIPAIAADAHLLHRTLRQLPGAGDVDLRVAIPRDEQPAFRALEVEHPHVCWVVAERGRARQMNAGAVDARGRWILFLHCDSVLPVGWKAEILRADSSGSATWGCFRFALDARGWRARLLEVGVAARVALLRLPYGDQGLFTRRDVFDRAGGFPDLPLMEDVALAGRLGRRSPPWRSPLPLRTSARRWTLDGWLARSAGNVLLVTRYLTGASPAALAAAYARPPARVVVIDAADAVTPQPGTATRPPQPWRLDGTGVQGLVPLFDLEATVTVLARLDPAVRILRLPGAVGGGALEAIAAALVREGISTTVLVRPGSTPSSSHLAAPWRALGRPGPPVVLVGSSTAGPCSLIGLGSMDVGLVRGLGWESSNLVERLRDRALARGFVFRLLTDPPRPSGDIPDRHQPGLTGLASPQDDIAEPPEIERVDAVAADAPDD